jgi:hypothetical protein
MIPALFIHCLVGDNEVRWWTEIKVIRWYDPRRAGECTRCLANEEGEWAVFVLPVGVERRVK